MKEFFKYLLATIVGMLLVFTILFFISLGALVGIASFSNKPNEIDNNSVLKISLHGNIVERKQENPFEDFFDELSNNQSPKEQGLSTILKNISKASKDNKIQGIYLECGMLETGYASLDEIRNALTQFQMSGKFVIAYGGFYSQKAYYVATVADEIFINPLGMLDLRGLNSEVMFYKEALEKLDVEVNIIKHGKYKSAVEPFTRDNMSPEQKEQVNAYLKSVWDNISKQIASDRSVDLEIIENVVSKSSLIQPAEFYVKNGIVDSLMYTDQVIDYLAGLTGSVDSELKIVTLKKYTKTPEIRDYKGFPTDKIALIYAVGEIDGGNESSLNSAEIAEDLRKVRKDSAVKAVVLRVNSPGGSAFGSEQIWREVALTKKIKPVIVSMGDLAASGGYYISCDATEIMASPSTITGSIGIFGMMFSFGETAKKIGISFDRVKTHEYADFPSVTRKMTSGEKNMLQGYIERGYDTFVSRCAEGRETTFEDIDKIGQGRVWTGSQAIKIQLIDTFGYINDAIKLAAQKSDTEIYRIVEFPEEKDMFQEIFEDLQSRVKNSAINLKYGVDAEIFMTYKSMAEKSMLQARMPYDLIIE